MNQYSDKELIQELNKRLKQKQVAIKEAEKLNDQLKNVNQKLEEAEALKSHFISNIRNQIINPFASILGLSKNIMLLNKDDLEKVKKMSKMIYAEAFELDFQLKNIFAAAKIEAGDSHPEILRVNIIELIENVIFTFKHRADEKQIKVKLINEIECDESEKKYFNTDPLKFQLILSNLLSNAIEYSSAANKVEVITKCDNNKLMLIVKDYGIGIDEVDQRIIFDRFKRLDTSINSINRGHGLGLSVTKSLVDILEGEIHLHSQKTQGSVFTVTLPEKEVSPEMEDFTDGGDEFFFDDDDDEEMENF